LRRAVRHGHPELQTWDDLQMDEETGVLAPLAPPMDDVGPWTIKAVPTATRQRVIVAARKEGLTVGQWLERRINEWTDDGNPVRVGPGQPETALVLSPVTPGQPVSELAALVRLAQDISPEDSKRPALMAAARAAVLRRLRAL
jgi:hypothetical protein